MQSKLIPGLVSVTFRKLTPREIVDLAGRCGLRSLEWGGDIHAPHGDLATAREIAAITEDAGLETACYGSYYRVGESGGPCFEEVLASARELHAPAIRVWAGKLDAEEATEAYWSAVIDDSERIAQSAAEAGMEIVFEFHGKTLTNTYGSARRLLDALPQTNIGTLWQPISRLSAEENAAALPGLLPRLRNVHCFHWESGVRQPLARGEAAWLAYLDQVRALGGRRHVLLEFVLNDDPRQLIDDAATLRRWIGEGGLEN